MKIVIPFMGLGKTGGYKVLSNLANNWVRKGHEVHVLLYEGCFSGRSYFPLICTLDTVDDRGRLVRSLDACLLEVSADVLAEPHSRFKRVTALARGLKKNYTSFDAVLANENLTAYCAALSGIKRRFYYIQAYECLYDSTSLRGIVLNMLARFSYRLPLMRVVNAEIYRDYENIKSDLVIPPGMDLSVFTPVDTVSNSVFTIGCIGRKESWKGSEVVAEAVSLLRDRGYCMNFHVAFNPVQSCDKYKLIQADGDSSLAMFYRGLDVLVAPGTIQLGAIHYPVIEAMACGVPVVTTGYYPADESNSYLVPINSPEAIASAILDIWSDPKTASEKGKLALKQVEQLSWEIVSQEFISVLEGNSQ